MIDHAINSTLINMAPKIIRYSIIIKLLFNAIYLCVAISISAYVGMTGSNMNILLSFELIFNTVVCGTLFLYMLDNGMFLCAAFGGLIDVVQLCIVIASYIKYIDSTTATILVGIQIGFNMALYVIPTLIPCTMYILLCTMMTFCYTKTVNFLLKKKNTVVRMYFELDNKNETHCSICSEYYDQNDSVRVIICEHYFHLECVDQWFYNNSTCPVCRYDINTEYNEAETFILNEP